MEKRFIYGYDTKNSKQKNYNLNEFKDLPILDNIDPEFKRRLLGLICFTVSQGKFAGIGSSYRSSDVQIAEFKNRYKRLTAKQTPSYEKRVKENAKKYGKYRGPWDGSYWELKKGYSPIATPGSSYHESTTPDNKSLAADLIGDTDFMGAVCNNFGIIWFGESSLSEKWHFQPFGIPSSRNSRDEKYDYSIHHPLAYYDYSSYFDFKFDDVI